MKCASATAGVASVMTGLAVVLSGSPAHATFIFLNQSQLIGSTLTASSIAASSGGSATTDLKGKVYEDSAPAAAATKGSDTAQAHSEEMVYAGLQPTSADARGGEGIGSDDGSSYAASYSTPFELRWTTLRGAAGGNGAYPWHRPDSAVSNGASTGSSASNSPAKDSPAGSGGVTVPAPAATAPAANIGGPTSPSIPNEVDLPPLGSIPIGSLPPVEAPIVGVPSQAVPEPSTVGLLGVGLLLVFVAIARGKRARYYSKVSGSPRSSRRMGSLARTLIQSKI